jgi:hypothetical protein
MEYRAATISEEQAARLQDKTNVDDNHLQKLHTSTSYINSSCKAIVGVDLLCKHLWRIIQREIVKAIILLIISRERLQMW